MALQKIRSATPSRPRTSRAMSKFQDELQAWVKAAREGSVLRLLPTADGSSSSRRRSSSRKPARTTPCRSSASSSRTPAGGHAAGRGSGRWRRITSRARPSATSSTTCRVAHGRLVMSLLNDIADNHEVNDIRAAPLARLAVDGRGDSEGAVADLEKVQEWTTRRPARRGQGGARRGQEVRDRPVAEIDGVDVEGVSFVSDYRGKVVLLTSGLR